MTYEHGKRTQSFIADLNIDSDSKFGKFVSCKAYPENVMELSHILKQEQKERNQLETGNFEKHISDLQHHRIEREVYHITNNRKELTEPNTSDKSHFMTEISPVFRELATQKDYKLLSSLLPYRTVAFQQGKDKEKVYAVIGKTENRSQDSKKFLPSKVPSVKEQLANYKQMTAVKNTNTKTKNHDLIK